MQCLRIERRDNIAVLRLDKARGNAIDEPLIEELAAATRELDADASVAGVLLASAHPKVFCPGLDLLTLVEFDRPRMKAFMLRFAEAVWGLYGMGKPVVAAVGGHAVAGGCILALTADRRVLRRGGAQMGLNEVRVGVPLPWTVALLLRATVPARALTDVALLGRNFADEDAVAAGLADELAGPEGFEEHCLVRVAELSDKDAQAVATTKRYLREPILREMAAQESERMDDWLDVWFSEGTRRRIQEIVLGLSRSRA